MYILSSFFSCPQLESWLKLPTITRNRCLHNPYFTVSILLKSVLMTKTLYEQKSVFMLIDLFELNITLVPS